MSDSILTSIKEQVGVPLEYSVYDANLLLCINSVFSDLNQLGVGPAEGFAISDSSAVWSDFLGSELRLNAVKTYMGLSVRMLFDPPTTGYLLTAMQSQIDKLEWRINVAHENDGWVNPNPVVIEEY